MPLAILHNSASQLALSEINKETSDACKSLKKASTGQKITTAQDDDAGYQISERMTDQIRSLAQDNQNTQNGAAMLKIASGGVENIVENLRYLKEMAINAATDTNTDDDRAILQKTAEQILGSINDIATTTNYNSKTIIDGTFSRDNAPKTPLIIHTGTKSSQNITFYVNDMHTKSLKGTIRNESDEEILAELQSDTDKWQAYSDMLDEIQNLTLDDINLKTRPEANKAIRIIDGAIEYALDQATNLGAFMQRLEHTSENITTAEENTQAAQSTIRDADMAREISNYTKANVLSQAAQAMLAQANQNSSRVLSLLR